jgi:hypothetical protein
VTQTLALLAAVLLVLVWVGVRSWWKDWRKQGPSQVRRPEVAVLKERLDSVKRYHEKRLDRDRLVNARLERLGATCLRACDRLGRPAKDLAELKPHLKDEQDLRVPGCDDLFVIAWGVHPARGASPLAWEPAPDSEGLHWVLLPCPGGGACARVGEQAFARLTRPPGK